MDKLATLFGLSCSFISGLFASLSVVHAGLVVLCFGMMNIDSNPESTWNCGVLIYGSEAVIYFLISLPCYFLARFTLWTNPLKLTSWLIGATGAFLVSSISYSYAFVSTSWMN